MARVKLDNGDDSGQFIMNVICSFPRLNELSAITLCVLNSNVEVSQPGFDAYCRTIWKCRELIFVEHQILASPIVGALNVFQAIVPMDLVQVECFVQMLYDMDLQLQEAVAATPETFQTCLKYTIMAKLAPEWNQVGSVFVEGRNFLSAHEKLSAVEMLVNVSEGDACIKLECFNIKMPFVKLEDLGISLGLLASFNQTSVNCIEEYHIGSRWCHVLPSMNKGEIYSITRDILPNPLFEDYEGLRKYWKNTCERRNSGMPVSQPISSCSSSIISSDSGITSPDLPRSVHTLKFPSLHKPFQDLRSAETQPLPSPVAAVGSDSAFGSSFSQHLSENSVVQTPYFPRTLPVNVFGSTQEPKILVPSPSHHLSSPVPESFESCTVVSKVPEVFPTHEATLIRLQEIHNMMGFSRPSVKGKKEMVVEFEKATKKRKTDKSEIDIYDLARRNKLSRVSNSYLLDWLKAAGVPCGPRLKKAELIDKINYFIKLSEPEQ